MGEINAVVVSSREYPSLKKRLPKGWTFFKEHDKWFGVTKLESGGDLCYTLYPEWEGETIVMLEVSLIVNSLLNGRQTT